MSEKMLKFTQLDQVTPVKRLENERKKDFNEIYKEFISEKAKSSLAGVHNAEFLFVKFIAR